MNHRLDAFLKLLRLRMRLAGDSREEARETSDEVQAHVLDRVRQLRADNSDMSEDEATSAALDQFGPLDEIVPRVTRQAPLLPAQAATRWRSWSPRRRAAIATLGILAALLLVGAAAAAEEIDDRDEERESIMEREWEEHEDEHEWVMHDEDGSGADTPRLYAHARTTSNDTRTDNETFRVPAGLTAIRLTTTLTPTGGTCGSLTLVDPRGNETLRSDSCLVTVHITSPTPGEWTLRRELNGFTGRIETSLTEPRAWR